MRRSVLLNEIVTVCAWNFRTLAGRLGPATVAVAGFIGVVLVFVGMFSIRQGFQSTLATTGARDVAKVKNSDGSRLSGHELDVLGTMPGVAENASGAIVAGAYVVSPRLPKRGSGEKASVTFRGVPGKARQVWRKVHIVRGRWFKPGVNEVIVGRMAARTFGGLRLGQTFHWAHRRWKVAGIFASGGNSYESEVWLDADNLQAVYDTHNQFTAAYVRLESASAFPAFKQALKRNPELSVTAERESSYFREAAGGMSAIIGEMGGVIAFLMAIGAIFGAVNILYANVADRVGEIATLRALGFTRTAIVSAVLLEATVLALAGGIIGAGIAYLAFNGIEASTFAAGAVVAFKFAVTPALVAAGIGLALVMGLIGGVFPAIRAARLPIATALREF
jgi:putative ABC transport system permease protein